MKRKKKEGKKRKIGGGEPSIYTRSQDISPDCNMLKLAHEIFRHTNALSRQDRRAEHQNSRELPAGTLGSQD